jgi:hypothetical protein
VNSGWPDWAIFRLLFTLGSFFNDTFWCYFFPRKKVCNNFDKTMVWATIFHKLIWSSCWRLKKIQNTTGNNAYVGFCLSGIVSVWFVSVNLASFLVSHGNHNQGCQIYLDTIYQNGGKFTKLPEHYQMVVRYTKWPLNTPDDHKIYQHFSF